MSDMWVLAILVDESGTVHSTIDGASVPEAFRGAWRSLKERMGEENPPGLTMTISASLRPFARITKKFEATHLTREVTLIKCKCEVCGWDEAAKHFTRFSVTDAFGFRDLMADIEGLFAEESATFVAPHLQVKVKCDMCDALIAKGISPVTMQPVPSW